MGLDTHTSSLIVEDLGKFANLRGTECGILKYQSAHHTVRMVLSQQRTITRR